MYVVLNIMMSLSVMSQPLAEAVGAYGSEVIHCWSVCFRGELGFMKFDDIYMCVVNKQFELIKFVFDSVYVDLQYDYIFLILLLILCASLVSAVRWSSLACL